MRRTLLRDVLFGLLGAVSLIGGVVLADSLFDDSVVILPDSEASFVIQPSDAAAPDTPGAILTRVEVPAPDPLFEGATVLHPTVFDADGIPAPDAPASSSASSSGDGDLPGGAGQDGSPGDEGPSEGADPDGSAGDEGSFEGADPDGSAGDEGPSEGADQDGSPGDEGPSEGADQDGSAGDERASEGADLDASAGDEGTPGAAAGNAIAIIARFFDLCAEPPAPACPSGIGATVLADYTTAPLQFNMLPEATRSLHPDLRCHTGWPTQTVIPLVLLSNRPLDSFEVLLTNEDGQQLDLQYGESPQWEHHRYNLMPDSEATFPTIGGGFHTCVQLEIDPPLVTTPVPDRNGGTFVVRVRGRAEDDSLTRTMTFAGNFPDIRPPVELVERNANQAHLFVPQIGELELVDVWLYETSIYWDPKLNAPRSCEGDASIPWGESLDERDTYHGGRVESPRPYSEIMSSGYPWDRSYTHFTTWWLDLRNSTEYTLCINWFREGRTEQWLIETPDGIRVEIVAGDLIYKKSIREGELGIYQYGVTGCETRVDPQPLGYNIDLGDVRIPFPAATLHFNGTYNGKNGDIICNSGGWRIAPEITLEARYHRSDERNYPNHISEEALPPGHDVYGVIYWPTAELISKCTDAEVGRPPCRSILEWWNLNAACGGGLYPPSCFENMIFFLQVDFNVIVRDSNNRPDPLKWGFYPGPDASVL